MAASCRLVVLALVSAALACTPVCDEAGLRRAADDLAAGPERRQAGLDALHGACPTLPAALARRLHGDGAPLGDDEAPGWQELLLRTCPNAATPGDERGVRRRCDLDRYGLLAADAMFAQGDVDVFMLFEWLVGGRVDRSLAAQVATPLLTAQQFATWGVTPPRSRLDIPPSAGGPQVVLSPTGISVDETPVLTLAAGRPAAGAFVRHVSPPLRAALAAALHRGRAQAERDGRPSSEDVRLIADRSIPFATIADVLFTASKAGYRDFELVVEDGEQLRGRPFVVPLAWFPPDDVIRDGPVEIVFTIRPDVVISGAEGRDTRRFTQPVGAALAAHVNALKRLIPNETVASLRVDGQIPLQSVVSLMDAVSGEHCALRGALAGEAIPDDCLFWQHVLDLDPPLDVDSDREP